MNGIVRYGADFAVRRKGRTQEAKDGNPQDVETVPRISRLIALAIRLEELIREHRVRDYAAAARLGNITRARMTQIMKLRNLASDIQEEILFLPAGTRLNERNLRSVSQLVNWEEQRRRFREFLSVAHRHVPRCSD